MHSIDFHAHHSPLGAYATFTCGRHGAGGGLRICSPTPPGDDLLIGWVDGDGRSHVLPFTTSANVDTENYAEGEGDGHGPRLILKQGLERHYGGGTDAWTCGPLRFAIHTPVANLPDPEVDGEAALAGALLPVVACDLEFDNRTGTAPVDLIFAWRAGRPGRHLAPPVSGGAAVAVGPERALATANGEAFVHWDEREFVAERRSHLLGGLTGLARRVAAGEQGRLRLVLGFHRAGMVTTGLDGRFYYTRSYPTLESVLAAGLALADELAAAAADADQRLAASGLDEHQQFLVAHAERSYWGNSQMLDIGGQPRWVVYEGEYAMMNTFDLSVDQVFYEMRRNPWVVRNICDQFLDRYSYRDRLARPADDAADRAHRLTMCRDPARLYELVPEPAARDLPGGISFCHDMGVNGNFTPPGHSSYEIGGLAGCFSYMTCEQLYNWVCTATTYLRGTDDRQWLGDRRATLRECLESLLNRDDPDPTRRNGSMGLDSSRCQGGWEITTYDSLDHSLGQARNNLYMAVKGWAACLGLEWAFKELGDLKSAVNAQDAARRAAAGVVARFDAQLGYVPAVFEGGNTSAIIPAVEGLVFPLVWGFAEALQRGGPYGAMLAVLERHLRRILTPGLCLFDDGGWKLSSTADNSWMSKIFICQHVAARVFALEPAPESHAAHAHWQQIGSADWAMSDQCFSGIGKASKYYPRCVTNDLWLG